MTGAVGGVEKTSRARVGCAWTKFRELTPVLTSGEGKLLSKCKERYAGPVCRVSGAMKVKY